MTGVSHFWGSHYWRGGCDDAAGTNGHVYCCCHFVNGRRELEEQMSKDERMQVQLDELQATLEKQQAIIESLQDRVL